jgi:hypothetical protein
VSKHGTESGVSDTFDAFHCSVELVINDYATPVVDFYTDFVQIESFSKGSTTHGNENDVDIHVFLFPAFGTFEFHGYLSVALFGGGDFCVQFEFHTLFREDLLELFPDYKFKTCSCDETRTYIPNFLI